MRQDNFKVDWYIKYVNRNEGEEIFKCFGGEQRLLLVAVRRLVATIVVPGQTMPAEIRPSGGAPLLSTSASTSIESSSTKHGCSARASDEAE